MFKTVHRLQLRYYWPKLRQDVARYVAHCQVCQQVKYDQKKPAGLHGAQRCTNRPWETICADLQGPFPRSSKGFKYLLVVVDNFTKYSLLFPIRAATAEIVAKHLEENVFLVYGTPSYLICDNGSEFTGAKVKKLASRYKVKILYNASRHPQANPSERTNRTVISMIRAFVKDNHRDWDKHIAELGFALRTAKNETTGYTPAFLNFGREPRISGEEENGDPGDVDENDC